MQKKLLGAIGFFGVALLVVVGIATVGSRNKKGGSADKTNISQNEEKKNDEETQEVDIKNENIDQVLNAFLSEGTDEQTATKSEDNEKSLVSSDSDSINNLIQTYEENEF